MSVRHRKPVKKQRHQDHRLVGIIRNHLKGVKLKENTHFRIEPKIGGGSKESKIIIYLDAKHQQEHAEKLRRAAHGDGIPLEFKALAA